MGDNLNSSPIDKPCTSQDNKEETQLLSLQRQSWYSIKKGFLTKKIAAQAHGLIFENEGIFWNSVESSKLLIA